MIWPWKRKPPGDTGGRAARERAEEALEDVRQRRADQQGMLRWFRVDARENHYGRDIEAVIRGGKS